LAFLSQAHVDPDITTEMFFIDAPLEGFVAVEVLDPDVATGTQIRGAAPS
jgi:hypothetical protein